MKKIQLKEEKIEKQEGIPADITFNYKDELLVCLRVIPGANEGRPTGLTVDDIEKRLKIKEAIDNSESDHVLLEDADYAYLKPLIVDMRWALMDKVVLDFVNAVKDAKSVDVKAE